MTGEVRAWLSLRNDVRRWGTLPEAGGLLDQDAETMAIVSMIDSEVEEVQSAREA